MRDAGLGERALLFLRMNVIDRFFPPASRLDRDQRVQLEGDEEIRHEILSEASVQRVDGRPMFVGFAFSRRAFILAGCLVVLAGGLLISRAAWMQIAQGESYFERAERNRLRPSVLWPKRGVITDRRGVVLAENTPRFQVTVVPRDIPVETEERIQMLAEIGRLVGVSLEQMHALVEVKPSIADDPVLVADNLPYDQALALAVRLPALPAVALEARPRRSYPVSKDVPSLSHILGYVGKISERELASRVDQGYRRVDELGKTGVERSYEASLRGVLGFRTSEVDARGRAKMVVRDDQPIDGQTVRLTVDVRLQKAAEVALQTLLTQEKLARGSVVAMDPRSGEIRALVSLPAYDNNLFSGGVSSTVYAALTTNPDQPLFERAIAGVYPSGSTVKIAVSVAALMEGVVTPATTVLSTGGLRLGQWFFPDWQAGGHGTTNVRRAIAWSVNTFYYMVGGGYQSFTGMGPEKLSAWLQRFGLGSLTGIDLPGENKGFVPTKAWKEDVRKQPWYVGDTYNLSIGQGDLLVTPLQVARYTAAIANGGTLVTPHVAFEAASSTMSVGASAEAIEEARQGMRDAVVYGSARGLSVLPFSSGGKTGTAQWNSNRATHAWFTAFAPFEEPELVVTVLIEEGGEGSRVATPVAREVLRAWWALRAQE